MDGYSYFLMQEAIDGCNCVILLCVVVFVITHFICRDIKPQESIRTCARAKVMLIS